MVLAGDHTIGCKGNKKESFVGSCAQMRPAVLASTHVCISSWLEADVYEMASVSVA